MEECGLVWAICSRILPLCGEKKFGIPFHLFIPPNATWGITPVSLRTNSFTIRKWFLVVSPMCVRRSISFNHRKRPAVQTRINEWNETQKNSATRGSEVGSCDFQEICGEQKYEKRPVIWFGQGKYKSEISTGIRFEHFLSFRRSFMERNALFLFASIAFLAQKP